MTIQFLHRKPPPYVTMCFPAFVALAAWLGKRERRMVFWYLAEMAGASNPVLPSNPSSNMKVHHTNPVMVMALLTGVFISAVLSGCKPASPQPPAPPPDKTTAAPADQPVTRGAAVPTATNQSNWVAGADPFKQKPTPTNAASAIAQQKERPADTNWLKGRDIFDDPAKYEKELPRLELEEISVAGTNSWAVINQRKAGVGELVDGVRVVEIGPASVTVQYKTLKKVLNLKLEWPALRLEEIVHQPPAKPAAVINGKRVETGDTIAEAKVLAIDPPAGTVTMSWKGQQKILAWKAEAPVLRLQGIFFQTAKPSALINGITVFVGDKIEGAQVKAIKERAVIVDYRGQPATLELK